MIIQDSDISPVEVEQCDIECFKAIFGFTDEPINPNGEDIHTLRCIARHRLAERTPAPEMEN